MKKEFNDNGQKQCYEVKLTDKAAKKHGYAGIEKKIRKLAKKALGKDFVRVQPLFKNMKTDEDNTKVLELQESRKIMLAVQRKLGKHLKSITHTGTAAPSFEKSKRAYTWKKGN